MTQTTNTYGELLAVHLASLATGPVTASWQDGWDRNCAHRACTLLDAAIHAATLPDSDPQIMQMELAKYFATGRCKPLAHGAEAIGELANETICPEDFFLDLTEAARLDALTLV